jgi:hypothetical protein
MRIIGGGLLSPIGGGGSGWTACGAAARGGLVAVFVAIVVVFPYLRP